MICAGKPVSSYAVMFGPLAVKSAATLATKTVAALSARVDELSRNPWDMQAVEGKPHYRTAVFGPQDEGLIIATVSDDAKLIIVDQLVWAGL
jgi:hypothetical protein